MTKRLAPETLDVTELKQRFLGRQAAEAARTMAEGIVSDPREADVGSILGFGFARFTGGALSYIDGMGVKEFVALCDRLAAKHDERFSPPQMLRDMAQRGETFCGRAAERPKATPLSRRAWTAAASPPPYSCALSSKLNRTCWGRLASARTKGKFGATLIVSFIAGQLTCARVASRPGPHPRHLPSRSGLPTRPLPWGHVQNILDNPQKLGAQAATETPRPLTFVVDESERWHPL
jgi:hypothetical protein